MKFREPDIEGAPIRPRILAPAICAICAKPAACIGAYEGTLEPAYACDECCGHGNEDGYCIRLPLAQGAA